MPFNDSGARGPRTGLAIARPLGLLDRALLQMACGWRRGQNDEAAAARAEAAANEAIDTLGQLDGVEAARLSLGLLRSFVARHADRPTGQSACVQALQRCVAAADRARWEDLRRDWRARRGVAARSVAETRHLAEASPDAEVRAGACEALLGQGPHLVQ